MIFGKKWLRRNSFKILIAETQIYSSRSWKIWTSQCSITCPWSSRPFFKSKGQKIQNLWLGSTKLSRKGSMRSVEESIKFTKVSQTATWTSDFHSLEKNLQSFQPLYCPIFHKKSIRKSKNSHNLTSSNTSLNSTTYSDSSSNLLSSSSQTNTSNKAIQKSASTMSSLW